MVFLLTHTFQHIPEIIPYLEKSLWKKGILNWKDYLDLKNPPFISSYFHKKVKTELTRSLEELDAKNLSYFVQKLPANLHWRLFESFQEEVLYFDIEATGLDMENDYITIIGTYHGSEFHSYQYLHNLEEAVKILNNKAFWVTFNGNCFDIPFLQKAMHIDLPCLHIDIRELFSNLGHSGMLQSLELLTGYQREEPLRHLNGAAAVALWKEHIAGREGALRLLSRYNMEDVVSLENLAIHAYNMCLEKTPFAAEKISYKPRPILDNGWSRELAREVISRKSGEINDTSGFLLD